MSPLVERVTNSFPQVQRTLATVYSGWISVFMALFSLGGRTSPNTSARGCCFPCLARRPAREHRPRAGAGRGRGRRPAPRAPPPPPRPPPGGGGRGRARGGGEREGGGGRKM